MELPFAGCKPVDMLFYHPTLGFFAMIDGAIVSIRGGRQSFVYDTDVHTYTSSGTKSVTIDGELVSVAVNTRGPSVTHVTGGIEFDVIEDDFAPLEEGGDPRTEVTAMVVRRRAFTIDDIKVP